MSPSSNFASAEFLTFIFGIMRSSRNKMRMLIMRTKFHTMGVSTTFLDPLQRQMSHDLTNKRELLHDLTINIEPSALGTNEGFVSLISSFGTADSINQL